MIDWVLSVKEIPKRLLQYRDNAMRLKLPPEGGPPPVPPPAKPENDGEAALRDVLVFLRMRTGRDFSYYKRATILRRIGRRMTVNGVEDLADYLSFLRTHPGESGALLQDMLISVTNFFRDRDAFEELEKRIPEIFKDKAAHDIVRFWVPACATGEEAYSIAIILSEHALKLDAPPALQIFACDIDDAAIQAARAGHYPDTITADVSEERLRRFFIKDQIGYRVRRELREMVLFATHDLLKDPPFSRMDLVSCRNLLIYLAREAQERVFNIIHFALNPGGLLFIGSSEAVDEGSPMFKVIDKKHRIYKSRPVLRTGLLAPMGPHSIPRAMETEEPVVHGKRFLHEAAVPFAEKLGFKLDRSALTDLHFKLIERYAPPSVIINAEQDIIHLSEHVGAFLQLSGGEASMNLLKLAHPMLRAELRAAIFRASESHQTVETFGVPVELDGHKYVVDIKVSPAPDISPGLMLIVFERREPSEIKTNGDKQPKSPVHDHVVRQLEQELEHVKGQLRNTVEQHETSTEEFKASNEELQAMNEELRSASEELETSREELQSLNEELTTVNQEMKNKVEELAIINSDLQNLMASTSIATVFLDRELAIKRFTPTAVRIFNLIPSDVGRPLAHLKSRLEYPQLIEDAKQVLRTLVPSEREVRGDGRWYLARLNPYRTLEDQIAGVVLSLVDMTDRNQTIQALRDSEERMRILIESAKEYAIFTTDPARTIDSWSKGAQTMFGYSENEIIGQKADILFTLEDRENGDAEKEVKLALAEGRAANERWHARKDGSRFYGSGSLVPLHEKSGELRGFLKIMRDLTAGKRAEEALREHIDELTRFNTVAVGRENRMIELKQEINELCARVGENPRYTLTCELAAGGGGDVDHD